MKYKVVLLTLLTLLILPKICLGAISSISIVDDTIFNTGEKMIIIDWSSAYSDYITASKTQQQIKQETGYDVDRGFTLSITSKDEYSTYELTYLRQLNYVELIESETKIFGWNYEEEKVWVNNNCLDLDGDGRKSYVKGKNIYGATIKLYCLTRKDIAGDIYRISTPDSVFEVTFTFKADGKDPKTVTLSNNNNVKDGITTRFGNDVLIRWKGSLSTQQIPPIATNMYATRSRSGYWNIVDEYYITTYDSIVNSDGQNYVAGYVEGHYTKSFVEDTINTKINNILNTWTTNPEFKKSEITFIGNIMKLDLDEGIYIPTFQVFVNGKYYIKVIIPSGIPYITNLELPDLTSDYEGTVKVSVKNMATNKGDFIVTLDCDKVDVFTKTKKDTVEPGQTKIFSFRVVGRTSTQTKYTCTATAKDSVSQETSSKTESGNLKPRPQCNLGEQICRLENGVWKIYECDGTDFNILKDTCGLDEICQKNVYGKYICVKIGDGAVCGNGICEPGENYDNCPQDCPPPGCEWWDIPCWINELIKKAKEFAMWVGVIVIVLVGTFILWKIFKPKFH